MKPVILISMNVAPVGGVGADVLKCVRGFCQQRREVHVIYGFMDPATLAAIPGCQVNWHRVYMPKRPPLLAQIFLWAAVSIQVRAITRTSKNATIFCFERLPIGHYIIGYAPNSLWEKARKNMALSPFSKIPFRLWLDCMDVVLRNYYRGQCVMYAQRDKACFIREGGAENKVIRVMIPTDTHRFSPSVETNNRNYITIIGLSAKHKGIDIALKAWANISSGHKDITLRVVTHSRAVKRLVSSSDCQQVEIADFIPNVESYYHSSRLVLMPSMYETWGNVLVESLACGVPVIASTEVPSSEIITAPSFGKIINHDVNELATAIDAAIDMDMSETAMHQRHAHVKKFIAENDDLVSWISNV